MWELKASARKKSRCSINILTEVKYNELGSNLMHGILLQLHVVKRRPVICKSVHDDVPEIKEKHKKFHSSKWS